MSQPTPAPDTPAARSRLKLMFNIGLGLGFSALFIWLVVKDVDWGRFGQELESMRPVHLLYYFLILSVAHGLRLVRWGVTIRALGPVPWGRVLAVGAVGMMAIFSLPARLGELVRPLLIIEGRQLNFGQATATVVIERILDGLTMSAILFGTVMLLDPALVPESFIVSGYVAASVFGGLSLGLLVSGLTFRVIRGPLKSLLGRFSAGLADKVIDTIGGFFGALRLLGKPSVALLYMGLTLVIWGLSGLGIAVLFEGFPASTGGLPTIAAFTTLSVIVVGIMIPAGPGTVGVFHWAVVFALGMFAVDESAGLLVATTLHLLIAAVNIFWGAIAWIAGGIELTSPWRARPPVGATSDAP